MQEKQKPFLLDAESIMASFREAHTMADLIRLPDDWHWHHVLMTVSPAMQEQLLSKWQEAKKITPQFLGD